ncbi:hypothetical protein BHT94_19550 [Bacillus licheniformis]|uniref:DUF948 domain-containing protein n=1 Tax=Bacillus cabrialesii subsp. tritici TaxID=2944916 RepID=A0ABT9DKK0_9BACI|nr:DUF948 domain-containing protein [Bacillus cabrialesii]OLQ53646.1 hypothetical protein BHT94_19550 [Bacillus licheniformis]RJS57311.1 DUF948 domain-containing protein [Bacillus subtilis]MBU2661339.1 DUF948 domain-containing protein [Bacillus cabrialesii]MDO8225229.1 DUF948 domain-containing protein [Bacillus cabrialesii subsp. tritici]RPK04817.1 hypothetical protein BSBH6_01518 [Bacillus subtilis]
MVIVYISLAVLVISIIFLGFNVIQNKKKIDPALKELTSVTQAMQKQVEGLKTEAQLLTQKQKKIQQDVQMKKNAFQQTAAEVKEVPQAVKEVWQAGHFNSR